MRPIEEQIGGTTWTWIPRKVGFQEGDTVPVHERLRPADVAQLVLALEEEERRTFVAACRKLALRLPLAWRWAFADNDEIIDGLMEELAPVRARTETLRQIVLTVVRWMNDPGFYTGCLRAAVIPLLESLPPRSPAEEIADLLGDWIRTGDPHWVRIEGLLSELAKNPLPLPLQEWLEARADVPGPETSPATKVEAIIAEVLSELPQAGPPSVAPPLLPEEQERLSWQAWCQTGNVAELLRVRDALIAQRDEARADTLVARYETADLRKRASRQRRELRHLNRHLAAARYVLCGRWGQHAADVTVAERVAHAAAHPVSSASAALLDQCYWALNFCSGASDFQPGGMAEVGWTRVVQPLLGLLRREREQLLKESP